MSFIPKTRFVGRLFCVIGMLNFALAYYFSKVCLSGSLESGLMRGLINVALIYGIAWLSGESLVISYKSSNMVLVRGVVCALAGVCAAIATKLVKLSVFVIVSRTKAILMTYFGVWFLGNKFDYRTLLAAIVSIVGVMFIVAPSMFGFSSGDKNTLEMEWTISEIIGLACTGVFMVMDCLDLVLLVKMSAAVSSAQTNFIMNIILCFMNGVTLTADHSTLFRWDDFWNYLGIGFCFYGAYHFYVESSYLESNSSIQGTLQTTISFFSLIIDVLFLGVTVSLPNIFGCSLILASTLWVILINVEHQAPNEEIVQPPDKQQVSSA